MLKKARLLTRPSLAVISPARPESAKTASLPRDAPFSDLRSWFDKILNGDSAASPTRRRAQTWCSLFVAPCAPEGTPPLSLAAFLISLSDHGQIFTASPSFFFNDSFTFPGFAFPPETFITCPTRNPSTCCLPSLS